MLTSILFAILFRPSVLIFIGLLVVAALAVAFLFGPRALLKWALDARVWLAVAGFATILAIGDLKKENAKLKEEVARQELVLQGKQDAQATLEVRRQARERRTTQATTIRDATTRAADKPSEVIDATLDAIAQVQDGGLDGRKRTDPEPRADGVRDAKRPDGNVAP